MKVESRAQGQNESQSGCIQWGRNECQERLSVWTHFLTTLHIYSGCILYMRESQLAKTVDPH